MPGPGHEKNERMRAWARKLRPALGPALATALALVPACVGITWGLPSDERFARMTGEGRAEAVRAIVERQRADAPRKADGLAIVPLDRREPDTPGRMWRRFALYSDHPDEMLVFFALWRMKPGEFDLDPRAYHYGGLLVYPVGALVRAGGALGLVTVTRDLDVYLDDPGRFGRFYLVGRLYVLAWHAAGLVALFLLARSMFGPRAGYLAMVLYAIMPATVAFTHEMKPHVPGASLVIFAALALRCLRGTYLRRMLVAGALIGAATSMTPVCGVAVLLLPAAVWAEGELKRAWKPLLVGIACAAAVYAALNPYAVLQPGRVLAELGHTAGLHGTGVTLLAPVAFVRYLPDALTWPGLFAAAGAIVWLVIRRPRDARVLGVPLAVYLVVVSFATARSGGGAVNARFGCVLYPFLALFAAGALAELISRRRIAGVALASALVLSLALGSVPYAAAFVANARGEGTHARAADEIASRVPGGAEIGLWGRHAPFKTPRVELGRYKWRDAWARSDAAARPRWFLAVGDEAPPRGYIPGARIRAWGVSGFGRPERMSYACPAFSLALEDPAATH